MNGIVYHIASGHSFFSGIAFIIIGTLAAAVPRPIAKRIGALSLIVGVVGVLVSSTAIPYWIYGLAAAITVGWIVSQFKHHWHRPTAMLTVGVWALAALIELPYHFVSALKPVSTRGLAVIGDSVSAGMGGSNESETWPSIIAREHQLDVQNNSHVGETAQTALKRVQSNPIQTASIVLIEIGGNDLLGSTSTSKFKKDLDALLAHVAVSDRQLLMFELPLPPFCNEYGRIQRRMAAKHNVCLIPKRVFLSVIADKTSTLDSIHLTQSGHQQMSDCVWRLVRLAYDANQIE